MCKACGESAAVTTVTVRGRTAVTRVAVGGEHSCGCGTRAGPTKRDVVEALKEAWREMEACVTSILDCMEELRYELRGDDDGD